RADFAISTVSRSGLDRGPWPGRKESACAGSLRPRPSPNHPSCEGTPMAAHSSRTSVHTVDSLSNASGSIFDSLMQGASDIQLGASDTQVSAAEALPATGRFIGRVLYNTSYAVSFGVTFPVMMIVRIVPKENALVHGLVDGALAARDRVHEWGGEMVETEDHHE